MKDVTNAALYQAIKELKLSVDLNTRDIIKLNETVNMGKGAVRVLWWIGSIIIAIIGWKSL
jgi:hypothetical protein